MNQVPYLGHLVYPPLAYPWRPVDPPPDTELLRRVIAGLERLQSETRPSVDIDARSGNCHPGGVGLR